MIKLCLAIKKKLFSKLSVRQKVYRISPEIVATTIDKIGGSAFVPIDINPKEHDHLKFTFSSPMATIYQDQMETLESFGLVKTWEFVQMNLMLSRGNSS